ncbi:MAG: hypothetical protein ACPGLV_06790, partial [Bacteroidia bacterium]
METLVAILFYIGAISANTEYTETEIYSIEAQYQQSVDQIENDPNELDLADDIWDDAAFVKTGHKIFIDDSIDM